MGVWNAWGYGIASFRALNFQMSEPEIWQTFAVSAEFLRMFLRISAPEKYFLRTLENGHSIRHHTPTKCRLTSCLQFLCRSALLRPFGLRSFAPFVFALFCNHLLSFVH